MPKLNNDFDLKIQLWSKKGVIDKFCFNSPLQLKTEHTVISKYYVLTSELKDNHRAFDMIFTFWFKVTIEKSLEVII